MSATTSPIDRLTKLLGRAPGIGEKTAERLALWLVKQRPDYLAALGSAITHASTSSRECAGRARRQTSAFYAKRLEFRVQSFEF